MPPNVLSTKSILQKDHETDQPHLECPKKLQAILLAETENETFGIAENIKERERFSQSEQHFKWNNIFLITLLHVLGIYYLLKMLYLGHWKIFTFVYLMGTIAGIGVTAGAHRHWTHKAYKANVPVRIILMLCFVMAGQNSIFHWVRDHRVHHKYSETDADPHNSNRGFFFSHVGWLMMKRHPQVLIKGREIDMSDVLADPVVAFQEKYFYPLRIFMLLILPSVLAVYVLDISWYSAITSQFFVRYMLSLNFTWSVNSFAHLWGSKPYDRNIAPVETRVVSVMALGEGFHNYHHVFPWDYKAAELGSYTFNVTTAVIDFFALLGWVTDRKQPSPDLVKAIIKNRGDGSHPIHQEVPMPQEKLD